uniref:Uncharacterized protein n=1 Tax=Triticum urartu TaxID=4572 RepID=A0A8R7NWH0_TRIUA
MKEKKKAPKGNGSNKSEWTGQDPYKDQNDRRSGVLALMQSVAQMGWVLGPSSSLCAPTSPTTSLSSSPTTTARRNPSMANGTIHLYMDAVRSCLGPRDVAVCGNAQYTVVYASQLTRASCLWRPATAAIKRATTRTAAGWGDVPGDVPPCRGRPLIVPGPGDRPPLSPSSPLSCPSPTPSLCSS